MLVPIENCPLAMISMTLDLSDEIDGKLNEIAKRNGITKAEAMRKAGA